MGRVLNVNIGVDVGGTNTDAAVLHHGEVIGSAKHVTTGDVTSGISLAVQQALTHAVTSTAEVDQLRVLRVHIGTTHFVNAVLQRRDLARVAVLRLCGPASAALPPFSDFPQDLLRVVCASVHMVDGGFDFDGKKQIRPIDEDQIISVLGQLKQAGKRNIVVSGIFSMVNPAQEERVGELISEHYPSGSFTLSHHVGRLGLLERENAAILNESLKALCQKTITSFEKALSEIGLTCPFFLTQNDGTLMTVEQAQRLPVFTFASGTTNSMRGAAFLSGVKDAVVVDIGGTSTDIGVLTKGFPRQASVSIEIGSVRTNFSMPDVLSIGLGGGSLITNSGNQVKVGPVSVGNKLETKALIFGGSVLTASDVAVGGEIAEMGSRDLVKDVDKNLVKETLKTIHSMVEDSIDRMKVSEDPVPVILVGGGSVLLDKSQNIMGCSEVIIPPNHSVANAVGAALSQVSSTVDIVVDLSAMTREEGIEKARQSAISAVTTAGADPNTIEITEMMDVPLAYLPSNATRVHIKAVGDLLHREDDTSASLWSLTDSACGAAVSDLADNQGNTEAESVKACDDLSRCDNVDRTPHVDTDTGEWLLTEYDVECIALGAGILGCGGGGSPHFCKVLTQKTIREGLRIRVITPERFVKTAEEGDIAVMVCQLGAPTVLNERLISYENITVTRCLKDVYANIMNGREHVKADGSKYNKMEENDVTSIDHYEVQQRGAILDQEADASLPAAPRVAAIFTPEIGGSNGLEQLWTAGYLDIPVLDCDVMGRAFPELQQCTHFISGHPTAPACVADYDGRLNVVLDAPTPKHLENHYRKICIDMGCTCGITMSPFFKKDFVSSPGKPGKVINHSLSRAWRLGHAVLESHRLKVSAIETILDHEGGKLLLIGKICELRRETAGGFARGSLVVEGFDQFSGVSLTVDFQNENLVATRTDSSGQSKVLACVPDLIALVDSEKGQPICCEDMRYGLRVAVIAMPAPPELTSPAALEVVGPQAFGYSEDEVVYESLMQYIPHDPVPAK